MDPGGVALGAASLAITVCGGIIKYADSWRTQDQDVKAVKDAATQLRSLLEELESRIQTQPASSMSPVAVKLNSCLLACQTDMESLLKLSEKYTPPLTPGWTANGRHQIRRLTFPFKRDTLFHLRDSLEKSHRNVDTALHILTYDQFGQQHEDVVNDIKSLSISQELGVQRVIQEIHKSDSNISGLVNNIISPRLSQLETNISSKIALSSTYANTLDSLANKDIPDLRQCLVEAVETTGGKLQAEVHRVGQDFSGIQTYLQEQSRQLEEMKTMMARESTLLDLIRNGSHAGQLSKTESEDIISEVITVPEPRRRFSRQIKTPKVFPRHSSCTCGLRRVASCSQTWAGPIYYMSSNVCEIHDKACQVWYRSRGQVTYKFYLGIARFSISGSIDISYSPFSWMKGWAISPQLTFRPTVSNDSPAFRIIYKLMNRYGPSYCACNHHKDREVMLLWANSHLQQLAAMFRRGKASPYDANLQGENLLHIVGERWVHEEARETVLAPILRFLTSEGLDWQHHDVYDSMIKLRSTPFSNMFRTLIHGESIQDSQIYTVTELLHMALGQSYITKGLSRSKWAGRLVSNLHRLISSPVSKTPVMEALECGPISMAIMSSRQTEAHANLPTRRINSAVELNVLEQSPLHLAVGRPDRLRLLDGWFPESEINSFDILALSALDHALIIGEIDSARLLLQFGAILSFDWLRYEDSTCSRRSEFLSATLRSSRLRVRDLGFANLPEQVAKRFSLDSNSVPDIYSQEILQQLIKRGINVPASIQSLSSQPGSIYHWCGAENPELLKYLYNDGFQDIDAEWHGITPLMAQHSLHTIDFLIKRGARLNDRIPIEIVEHAAEALASGRSCLTIHKVTSAISDEIDLSHPNASITIRNRFHQIFKDTSKDISRCKCSTDGCSPLSIVVRNLLSRRFPYGKYKILSIATFLEALISQHDGPSYQENLDQMAQIFLRNITFLELGLTHTCCTYRRFYSLDQYPEPLVFTRSPDEIAEIQDEECVLIRLLDVLVEEFMAKFKEIRGPLSAFVEEYWRPRMRSVNEEAVLDEEEIAKIRQVGVVVMDASNSETESEDVCEKSIELCTACRRPMPRWAEDLQLN